MGLSTNDNNATYLSTFDGWFEQKLKEPRPGCIQRVNKNNETINVLRYNTLIGKIVNIEYKVTEKFGHFWSLTIVDDRAYKLDLSVTSSSTFYFLNRLINAEVDLKAAVELKVFAEVEGDKKKTVILLKQAGKQINGVYTKDNPQDLPAMEQIMFKGKLQWDSSKRDAFLRNIIETYLVPDLDRTAAPALTAADEPHYGGPPEDDELPEWAKEGQPVTPTAAAAQPTQAATRPAATPPTQMVIPPTPVTPVVPVTPVAAAATPKTPGKRRGS